MTGVVNPTFQLMCRALALLEDDSHERSFTLRPPLEDLRAVFHYLGVLSGQGSPNGMGKALKLSYRRCEETNAEKL